MIHDCYPFSGSYFFCWYRFAAARPFYLLLLQQMVDLYMVNLIDSLKSWVAWRVGGLGPRPEAIEAGNETFGILCLEFWKLYIALSNDFSHICRTSISRIPSWGNEITQMYWHPERTP